MRPFAMHPAGPPATDSRAPPAAGTGPDSPDARQRAAARARRRQDALELALFSLFYGCLMLAATQIGRRLGVFPALWPTDALAVGIYFLLQKRELGRHATAVGGVTFLVHLLVLGDDLALSLAGGIGSALTFALVGWGCERAGMERRALLSVPMVVSLAVVALVGTLPGALLTAFVHLLDLGGSFPTLFMRRWMPEMASVVLLLPPVLLWTARSEERPAAAPDDGHFSLFKVSRDEELVLAGLALAGAFAAAAYYGEPLLLDIGAAILLWFAFRLGVFPTAVAACAFSLAVIGLAVAQVWTVPQEDVMTTLLRLQGRLVLAAFPALLIAAIMAQRAHQERELKEDRRRLAYALEGANDGIWDWHVPTDAIFFSARAHRMLGYDPENAAQTLAAYQGLVHPDDLPTLIKSFKDHADARHILYQQELRARHRNGTYVWLLKRGKVVERDAEGRPVRAVGTLTDISQRKHLEAALEHAASHDPLTGLSNRAGFDRALEQARRRLTRDGALFAVVLIDIDHFKAVNDKFGHMAGDLLLTTAARRLQAAIRAGDLVARYGGDEFAMIASGKSKEEFAAMADRLHMQLSRPVEVEGLALPASFSMGMVVADDRTIDAAALIAEADAALYAAKDAGRGTWRAVGVAASPGAMMGGRSALLN
ncbi:diguanylate cyclase domain-containing protein [Xanthobacter sp. AM11]|uniref:diguanylate cyclase domain-containing protein n=1 Tax=Xanthobacter sp. AM11 TaxID=3380643 RepID=UPI0039BF15FC